MQFHRLLLIPGEILRYAQDDKLKRVAVPANRFIPVRKRTVCPLRVIAADERAMLKHRAHGEKPAECANPLLAPFRGVST